MKTLKTVLNKKYKLSLTFFRLLLCFIRCIDSEPLKWAKDNPSYQDLDRGFRRSLMTGSFHPVIEENFWKGVYPETPNPPTKEKHPLARVVGDDKPTASITTKAKVPGALFALPTQLSTCKYCSTFLCLIRYATRTRPRNSPFRFFVEECTKSG